MHLNLKQINGRTKLLTWGGGIDSQWSKSILKGENESQYQQKQDLVHGCFWLGFAFFFWV